MSKNIEKARAVTLRKLGFSYLEILKEVGVAKSTLSLWLRSVGLSKLQRQILIRKRIAAGLRGAKKRNEQRLKISETIRKSAVSEIGILDKKVFWLVGAALYWAEGNKQKTNSVSTGIKFSNNDPLMIKFFLKWLIDVCEIKLEDIHFEVYLHDGCDVKSIKKFWSQTLDLGIGYFDKIRYKPNKFYSYRKNKGENYHGLIRINVRRSTNLNRKIMGWTEGMCKQFGII